MKRPFGRWAALGSARKQLKSVKKDIEEHRDANGILSKFHFFWHRSPENAGNAPAAVIDYLEEQGFERVHRCSADHGEFVAYANGETKVMTRTCGYCKADYDYSTLTLH